MTTIETKQGYIYVSDNQYVPTGQHAAVGASPRVCYAGRVYQHNLKETQNCDSPQDVNVIKVEISNE